MLPQPDRNVARHATTPQDFAAPLSMKEDSPKAKHQNPFRLNRRARSGRRENDRGGQ
jgi:hypothetical protein